LEERKAYYSLRADTHRELEAIISAAGSPIDRVGKIEQTLQQRALNAQEKIWLQWKYGQEVVNQRVREEFFKEFGVGNGEANDRRFASLLFDYYDWHGKVKIKQTDNYQFIDVVIESDEDYICLVKEEQNQSGNSSDATSGVEVKMGCFLGCTNLYRGILNSLDQQHEHEHVLNRRRMGGNEVIQFDIKKMLGKNKVEDRLQDVLSWMNSYVDAIENEIIAYLNNAGEEETKAHLSRTGGSYDYKNRVVMQIVAESVEAERDRGFGLKTLLRRGIREGKRFISQWSDLLVYMDELVRQDDDETRERRLAAGGTKTPDKSEMAEELVARSQNLQWDMIMGPKIERLTKIAYSVGDPYFLAAVPIGEWETIFRK
jgi:hypothetical protein